MLDAAQREHTIVFVPGGPSTSTNGMKIVTGIATIATKGLRHGVLLIPLLLDQAAASGGYRIEDKAA